LSPYEEQIGEGEDDDPLHAPSLIAAIRDTRRQKSERTRSRITTVEPGQDRDAFRADLASAIAIARQNGIETRSIVFPRNQHNADYDDVWRPPAYAASGE
jgi:hypothetical protein